ncbi:NapC/NirT family cytochrome c [uncultured Desulfuromonas sp.]|uniref:NapC/NirT family cytochrome c n=1 Tax=uncultured Desulfuromonas sp. TaxID=181013 RepID=UPI0026040367|nr:NapC/NirT family cytochrome c [uncultured Desulfuromonas sp.]
MQHNVKCNIHVATRTKVGYVDTSSPPPPRALTARAAKDVNPREVYLPMMFKRFWNWSKEHILLVTVLSLASIGIMGFVNIEILHMTSEPEFCAQCHPGKGHGPLAEVDSWEHSRHGEAGVSCLDCHGQPGMVGYVKAKIGGLKDLYMQFTISKEEKLEILSHPHEDLVPAETCLYCHSDIANQAQWEQAPLDMGTAALLHMRLSDEVKNPEFRQRKGLPDILAESSVGGLHFDHAFHMESFELSCRDCHLGIVHRKPSKAEQMEQCLACHAENGDSGAPQLADCTGCHENQVAMNEGRGAAGVPEEEGLMYAAGIDCQMCHAGAEAGDYRPAAASCAECHDESYAELFHDWTRETGDQIAQVDALRAEVESALETADRIHRDTRAGWELYLGGLAKLALVEKDGTRGVHNPDYAQSVLQAATKEFEAVLENLKRTW